MGAGAGVPVNGTDTEQGMVLAPFEHIVKAKVAIARRDADAYLMRRGNGRMIGAQREGEGGRNIGFARKEGEGDLERGRRGSHRVEPEPRLPCLGKRAVNEQRPAWLWYPRPRCDRGRHAGRGQIEGAGDLGEKGRISNQRLPFDRASLRDGCCVRY